jgi:ubiquinone/menaquinone biosynthesis C-methylase UbiE
MSWSQKERAKIIAKTYSKWDLNNKKILDVGCGNAVVTKVLKDFFNADIYGTDIVDYRKEEISFKLMEEKNKLPFEDNSFDFVMLNDILHHSDNIEELLLEAKRISANVLIFEDKESLLLKVLDVGLNYFYCNKMPIPFNFKKEEEWISLFEKQGFSYKKGNVFYPFWYPLRHFAFLCTR